MKTVALRCVAHARSGDKGDTSNVAVIAHDRRDFELLRNEVTEKRVRSVYGGLVRGEIVRYELPRLGALNFVMRRALGGGVTTSLSLDPHGKTRSSLILTLRITVDDDYQPASCQCGQAH